MMQSQALLDAVVVADFTDLIVPVLPADYVRQCRTAFSAKDHNYTYFFAYGFSHIRKPPCRKRVKARCSAI